MLLFPVSFYSLLPLALRARARAPHSEPAEQQVGCHLLVLVARQVCLKRALLVAPHQLCELCGPACRPSVRKEEGRGRCGTRIDGGGVSDGANNRTT